MQRSKSSATMETAVLLLFVLSLLLCIVADLSVLVALVFGFVLFSAFALYKKHHPKDVLHIAFTGIRQVKNILLTFVLIGMITAIWRSSGTIAFIVYHATGLFSADTMVLATFLLCCLLSFLTGTAFGTAATMGVICASISDAMGISPVLTGGAVLAGSFFGDRCSPMSTSALLVSSVTKTNLFDNIKSMLRTGAVPFVLSCVIYFILSRLTPIEESTTDVCAVFAENYRLSPLLLIPAGVILLLSLLKVNVKIAMSVSIVSAVIIAAVVQQRTPTELLETLVFGFLPTDASLSSLMSGGGILSMKNVFCIVCISSAYTDIFEKTGLLRNLRRHLLRLAEKTNPFTCILLTSVVTCMIACNQTLAILLSNQLCAETEPDNSKMASHLANTTVVMAPLVPWSIASAVPLTSVGAPAVAIVAAVYLYLLPLCTLIAQHRKK